MEAQVIVHPRNPRISHDPFRSPDWRYQRVQELEQFDNLADRPRLTVYDDEYVRGARIFYSLRHGTDHVSLDDQFRVHEDCYLAFRIHDHVDSETRKIIEARILARQPDQEIAQLCATTPGAIQWYEKLFFNVRDRIDSRDWIVRNILTPSMNFDRAEARSPLQDRQLALRYFGYFGGPLILDAVFYGTTTQPMPMKPADIKIWMEHQVLSSMRAKAAIAAQTFEINTFNVMKLFEVFTALTQLERDTPSGVATNEVDSCVLAMFEELEVSVGTIKGADHGAAKFTAPLDSKVADLRDHELI